MSRSSKLSPQSGKMGAAIDRRVRRAVKRTSAKDTKHVMARISIKDWRTMMQLREKHGLTNQEQVMLGLGLLFEHFGLEPPESLTKP